MATLNRDTTGIPFIGVEDTSGNVYTPAVVSIKTGTNEYAVVEESRPLPTRAKAKEIAVRAYDGTTDAIAAGATKTYTATDLAGFTEFSVYIVEMTQTYTVDVRSRPVALASYHVEEASIGVAMVSGSIATRRHGFALDGPLYSTDIVIGVTNTSGSAATIKGVYIVGR